MLSTDYYNARYFNNVKADNGIVIKSSTNINKIKSEFAYYYFVPKIIQKYFIEPFDLVINEQTASYRMQQIKTKNVGELVSLKELSNDSFIKMFKNIELFKEDCQIIKINKNELLKESYELVIEKPAKRIYGFNLEGIDLDKLLLRLTDAFNKYKKTRFTWIKKISHGDLCLSNILWLESENTFKLIDPRGALVLQDIYLDEYYDLSKLAHSILSDYDAIINSGNSASAEVKEYFINYLNRHKISLDLLDVYQASLFLSMMPLHIENRDHMLLFADECDRLLKKIGF